MFEIYIQLKNVEFVFYLFDSDIDQSMKKKLSSLGLPNIHFSFPESNKHSFLEIGGGLYKQGDFACMSVPLSEAQKNSAYSAVFDPLQNTITVKLDGEFLAFRTFDDDADLKKLTRQKVAFVDGARFTDGKGKLIKKPRDAYGASSPLEGRMVKNSYEGESQMVDFVIVARKESV
jgi:hypothetical protein